jgi:hypothetical protein
VAELVGFELRNVVANIRLQDRTDFRKSSRILATALALETGRRLWSMSDPKSLLS